MSKIVLAYSGGLDTTCIIPWLKENYKADVVAFCANLGESEDEKVLGKRALDAGASEFYFEDLREKFIDEYVMPALRVGAVYEDNYLLATALARPLIGKELVAVAHKTRADAVAHGCTGKGNDQVRFELAVSTLDNNLKVIAPVREWKFKSREEELKYVTSKGIRIEDKGGGKYSLDRNLWGISIECGELEDPWNEPPKESYVIVKPVDETPDKPARVLIEFKDARPVKLDGKKMSALDMITALNKLGGEHGVGRVDMVEDRVVGIKSREVYEAPAGTILFRALRALESLVLEKDQMHNQRKLAMEYARLVYEGKWFSPLRESIQGFCASSNRQLEGEVKMRLFKGNAVVTGRKSPFSLYAPELATYTEKDQFEHSSAKGFIELWGLPLKVWGKISKGK
ncbi:MAG: argininosuccinate synthase [Elusimicrobia bacterium]|nr:argininosuccinate synthase [Elusimicrobiota bacterium]